MGIENDPAGDAGNDPIADILGTSAQPDPAAAAPDPATQQPGGTQEFKFGGRSYQSQAHAEKIHNTLYG